MDAQLVQDPHEAGLRERIVQRQRQRLSRAFQSFHAEGGGGSVLAVCGRERHRGQPMIAGDAAGPIVVTCALELQVQGDGRSRYRRSDGRHLSYGDGEFDWVCCDDVLEHAGGFMQQFALLKEMSRVAAKGLFVATANRRYPIDLDSGLPLLHWLPTPVWHRLTGQKSGQGRHLLSAGALMTMASLLPGKHVIDIGHVRLAGPKANFFMMIRKPQ
ncbi:methyltransferase domain-containing protein [Lacisediminimonas sp.]|uniref:methyltransferase domain-containing protein n=1 Tax=Lacisediminimonas sp. TaxID=3060582 RepID=UPI002717DCE1|nr:class I SAM-dependent methyltransferase [Lacisediminimonas sp.]MDO8299206.1 class I SAM-dependent methyltransferase [Lacisediminimonas sp.]